MKSTFFKALLIVVSGVTAATTLAQSAAAPAVSPSPPTPEAAPPAAPAAPTKVRIPEGTEVALVFIDALSSATNGEGDRFTLRTDGDVKIGGQVVIKSGSIAVGTVTNSRKRGYMGKAGELNVILNHVTVGDDRIKLRASKGKTGDAKVGATVALTVLFGPVGLLKRGHDIEIKPGSPITAFVEEATEVTVQP